VDFSFTEEQQMLRDSVTRFLQQKYDFDARQAIVNSDQPWSPEIWKAFGELGLLALPFPEAKGGFGGTITDIVAVAEGFGEHLIVEPYVSSILLAGQSLAASGNAAASADLTAIMSGGKTAAFAHEEGKGTPVPVLVAFNARKTEDGFILDGEKRMVLGAAQADLLIVSARIEGSPGDKNGLALFMVEPDLPGITITPFQTIDGRAAAHIRFDDVDLPLENLLEKDAFYLIQSVIASAIIALCAEAVGVMETLLKITGEYAATRKQFGTTIGTFQAIAHRMADMKIAYTKAQSTMIYTAALAEAGKAQPRDISILKGQIGNLGKSIGESAIQIHGGVGMTDELSVGHYHKRLLAIDALFGDSEYHLRRLGAE